MIVSDTGRWPVPWTRADAFEFVRSIDERMRAVGVLVGIYGSLLRDEVGRDLDLLLVPWRPMPSRDAVSLIFAEHGFAVASQGPSVFDASVGIAYVHETGRVIDCLFVDRVSR